MKWDRDIRDHVAWRLAKIGSCNRPIKVHHSPDRNVLEALAE